MTTYQNPGYIEGQAPLPENPGDIPSVYNGEGAPVSNDTANGTAPIRGENTPTDGQPISDINTGGVSPEITQYEKLARAMFPTMPQDFIRAYATAWVEYADVPNGSAVALQSLRTDSRYAEWFPGNLRADGTAHLSEANYWQQRAEHRQAVRLMGLDPDIFSDEQYISLISGDTSVPEFRDRVRTQANAILARSAEFRSYYSELYGFEPTDSGILQSVFTGNNDTLLREAGQATVGFEGELRGFDVSLQLASSLYNANVQTQGAAQDLFGQAAADVPLFGALAQRHFDADDDFDLGEFIQAAVFDDQEQLNRMQRLVSQERSLFSRSTTLRNRNGAVVGLNAE